MFFKPPFTFNQRSPKLIRISSTQTFQGYAPPKPLFIPPRTKIMPTFPAQRNPSQNLFLGQPNSQIPTFFQASPLALTSGTPNLNTSAITPEIPMVQDTLLAPSYPLIFLEYASQLKSIILSTLESNSTGVLAALFMGYLSHSLSKYQALQGGKVDSSHLQVECKALISKLIHSWQHAYTIIDHRVNIKDIGELRLNSDLLKDRINKQINFFEASKSRIGLKKDWDREIQLLKNTNFQLESHTCLAEVILLCEFKNYTQAKFRVIQALEQYVESSTEQGIVEIKSPKEQCEQYERNIDILSSLGKEYIEPKMLINKTALLKTELGKYIENIFKYIDVFYDPSNSIYNKFLLDGLTIGKMKEIELKLKNNGIARFENPDNSKDNKEKFLNCDMLFQLFHSKADLKWLSTILNILSYIVFDSLAYLKNHDTCHPYIENLFNSIRKELSIAAILFSHLAIASDPQNYIAYNNLAYLYYVNDQLVLAEENATMSIRISPSFILSHMNLHKIYKKIKSHENPIEFKMSKEVLLKIIKDKGDKKNF